MLTITDFLIGKFDYKFSALNIATTLEGRGIDGEVQHDTLSEKDKDLLTADLYLILANVSGGAGSSVKKGDTTVTSRSYNYGITDRTRFRQQANALYEKWGESVTEIESVQFVQFGSWE